MKIYENSITETSCCKIYMVKADNGRDYVVSGAKNLPLNHKTAQYLRAELPWTAPSPVLKNKTTFGTGDRLGIAGPGHIRCFEGLEASPVLAQQSIRELNLTKRTYEDVLDAATFAVFREGFNKPWGFDGDHLKTFEEIEYALKSGCTMITLDCSENLNLGGDPSSEQLSLYLNNSFEIEGYKLTFTKDSLNQCVKVYGGALDFISQVYEKYIYGGKVDFELSVDETDSPTTPLQHFFIANELKRRNIKIETLAPRFVGEFQKGIDYIGSLEEFEADIKAHAAIAKSFGYKLSIHSGSDKFSVFPIIAKYTGGSFHVKTAGTNWLEAMKLVAMLEPKLYRQLHEIALSSFSDAKKYYHISTEAHMLPDINKLPDAELPELFMNNYVRQLIHITYGFILNSDHRESLFSLWRNNDEAYYALIQEHIGKHLKRLLLGEAVAVLKQVHVVKT